MRISNAAIDRPRVVLVASALILCLTVFAILNISVQRTPQITKAVVLIAVPYPGAQPTKVEEQVARKIEDALQALDKVDYIASTSMRNSSVIQVMFLDGVDPDYAKAEVKHLVDQVRNLLPAGREVQPVITRIDFENMPIMLVNMTAPLGFDKKALKQTAEEVQKVLETTPGVANTQLYGGREREIHVDVNPYHMSEYGLTLNDVRQAVTGAHSPMPAGALDTRGIDAQVRNDSELRNVDDIREIIVTRREGKAIRLRDIAEVADTHRRLRNVAQLNGRDCATIIVNKEPGINALGTARAIKAQVKEVANQYPHLTFSTTQDTTEEISLMFYVLGSSAIFGAMLVLVLLAWGLGFRMSIIVLTAIPFSTAIALVFLFVSGVPLSNMVIFSFILVMGMVVDGAIIVAENIHRHIERGEDPVHAAKTGIAEVGLPVIAADLTTIAAFLPMLFVPGIMGDFMGVMPKVVTVALTGSILVDHFLIPVIASLWYRQREVKAHKPLKVLSTAADADQPATQRGGRSGDADGPVAESRLRPNLGIFARAYAGVLNYCLNNRWVVVGSAALAIFWAVVVSGRVEKEFFPNSDRGQFEVKYELPLGYSIHETILASERITKPLAEMKEESGHVLHFVTAIGSSGGLSARLENDPATGPEFGKVMVQLTSPLERDVHEDEIIEELRRRIQPIPGMKVTISQVEEGPPGGAAVAVRLTGKDLQQLGKLGESIAERLQNVEGTQDVSEDYRADSPEIVIDPIADISEHYGVMKSQVSAAIATAVLGDSTIELPLKEEDVTLRLQVDRRYLQNQRDIESIMLTGPSGRKASIGEVAHLYRTKGLYSVNRYDRLRAIMVRSDVMENKMSDRVFEELRKNILPEFGFEPAGAGEDPSLIGWVKGVLREWGWLGESQSKAVKFLGAPNTPAEGLRAEFTGENEEKDKNFAFLLNCMIIAVLLIFFILMFQFNSFRQAGVVMLSVPLSFIGVIAGLVICDFPFSLASFIGLVSLTGIVVNDAIVMVDFVNQARRRGLPLKEALIESGVNRLRPIVLTTVTTIGGLLPLMLNMSGGAEFWQPLTGAVIFGLAFATVLTLIVVPVAYSVAYDRTFRASRSREQPQRAA